MTPALLRFVPAYDDRAFLGNASGAPALMVSRGGFKKVRPHEPTPIVVDHDLGRVVGHAREICVREDVDYGARLRNWWFASCQITDPPGWLKRGGGVSWSFKAPHTRRVAGTDTDVIEFCLLEEISLLTPSTKPAEPLARVLWVGDRAHSLAAGGSSDRAVVGDSFDDPPWWDELERIVGYRVTDENWVQALHEAQRPHIDKVYAEHIAVNRRREPQVLIRPGIGQVLGVR